MSRWVAGNHSQIPLPKLVGKYTYTAELYEMATESSGNLSRLDRVATLTDAGMCYVQHKLIFHLTRLSIPRREILQLTDGLRTELTLQHQWNQLAVETSLGDDDSVRAAETQFDNFLSESGRRAQLRDQRHGKPRVVAEFNRFCVERFSRLPE